MTYEPPDRLLVGGCSFTASSSSVEDIKIAANKWPDHVVSKYPIKFVNNLAWGGGGNMLMIQNLSYALLPTKTSFPPNKTLILFNISGLERIDLMVSTKHPDINDISPWTNLLPYGWITSGGWFHSERLKVARQPPIGMRSGRSKKLIDLLQKNQEYEQVILANCLSLMNFMLGLQARDYRYYFMLMDDQIIIDAPEFFRHFLYSQEDKWIRFGEHLSMHAYGSALDCLAEDGFHLSPTGDKKIGDEVNKVIERHFV